jgi:hypothetical protein
MAAGDRVRPLGTVQSGFSVSVLPAYDSQCPGNGSRVVAVKVEYG